MLKKNSLSVLFVAVAFGLGVVSTAYAATPTLSITNTGSDSVQISVNGDPNSGVGLYYNVGSSGGAFTVSLGTTNASGAFSTTLGASAYGINPGSSMYVIVNGQQSATQTWSTTATSTSSGSGQTITFGLNNPNLAIGQSMNIAISGGSGYYVSSNLNAAVAQANVSGSALVLSGVTAGSDSITVCASSGGCGTISVTVANVGATQTQNQVQTQTTTQSGGSNASLLAVIQSMRVQLAQILSQIQTMANTLTQLASSLSVNAQTSVATNSGSGSYTFMQFLSLGSSGPEVTALQERLTALGFYSGSISGYFGAATETAVKNYQTAHGITPAGYVGPSTRAALNSGK